MYFNNIYSTLLNPCLDKMFILIIAQQASHCKNVIDAASNGQRYNGIERFILLHLSDDALNMHS